MEASMYIVKARYYAEGDNFGESYVITSNNSGKDMKLEIGQHIDLQPVDPYIPPNKRIHPTTRERGG